MYNCTCTTTAAGRGNYGTATHHQTGAAENAEGNPPPPPSMSTPHHTIFIRMKEFEEVKEHKSRLMMELEQEKKRLEDDIAKLNKNSVSKTNTVVSRREVMGTRPFRREVMETRPFRREVMGTRPFRREVMGTRPFRREVMPLGGR